MEIALLNKKKNNQNGYKKPDQCEYMRLSCRLSVCVCLCDTMYKLCWIDYEKMKKKQKKKKRVKTTEQSLSRIMYSQNVISSM